MLSIHCDVNTNNPLFQEYIVATLPPLTRQQMSMTAALALSLMRR